MGGAAAGDDRRRQPLAAAVHAASASVCARCWSRPAGASTGSARRSARSCASSPSKLDLKGMGSELLALRAVRRRALRRRRRRREAMADPAPDELEALSTEELHDRAVKRAERHLDVKFFWSLLQAIPGRGDGARRPGRGRLRHPVLQRPDHRRAAQRRGRARRGAAPAVHRLPAQAPRRVGADRDGRNAAPRRADPGARPLERGAGRGHAALAGAVRDALRARPDAPHDDRAGLARALLRDRSTCSAPTASPRPRG